MRSDRASRSLHPLGSLLLGLVAVYALGLGLCWLDIEVFSRTLLDRLPDPVLSALDTLYGGILNVHAPFVYQIF